MANIFPLTNVDRCIEASTDNNSCFVSNNDGSKREVYIIDLLVNIHVADRIGPHYGETYDAYMSTLNL